MAEQSAPTEQKDRNRRLNEVSVEFAKSATGSPVFGTEARKFMCTAIDPMVLLRLMKKDEILRGAKMSEVFLTGSIGCDMTGLATLGSRYLQLKSGCWSNLFETSRWDLRISCRIPGEQPRTVTNYIRIYALREEAWKQRLQKGKPKGRMVATKDAYFTLSEARNHKVVFHVHDEDGTPLVGPHKSGAVGGFLGLGIETPSCGSWACNLYLKIDAIRKSGFKRGNLRFSIESNLSDIEVDYALVQRTETRSTKKHDVHTMSSGEFARDPFEQWVPVAKKKSKSKSKSKSRSSKKNKEEELMPRIPLINYTLPPALQTRDKRPGKKKKPPTDVGVVPLVVSPSSSTGLVPPMANIDQGIPSQVRRLGEEQTTALPALPRTAIIPFPQMGDGSGPVPLHLLPPMIGPGPAPFEHLSPPPLSMEQAECLKLRHHIQRLEREVAELTDFIHYIQSTPGHGFVEPDYHMQHVNANVNQQMLLPPIPMYQDDVNNIDLNGLMIDHDARANVDPYFGHGHGGGQLPLYFGPSPAASAIEFEKLKKDHAELQQRMKELERKEDEKNVQLSAGALRVCWEKPLPELMLKDCSAQRRRDVYELVMQNFVFPLRGSRLDRINWDCVDQVNNCKDILSAYRDIVVYLFKWLKLLAGVGTENVNDERASNEVFREDLDQLDRIYGSYFGMAVFFRMFIDGAKYLGTPAFWVARYDKPEWLESLVSYYPDAKERILFHLIESSHPKQHVPVFWYTMYQTDNGGVNRVYDFVMDKLVDRYYKDDWVNRAYVVVFRKWLVEDLKYGNTGLSLFADFHTNLSQLQREFELVRCVPEPNPFREPIKRCFETVRVQLGRSKKLGSVKFDKRNNEATLLDLILDERLTSEKCPQQFPIERDNPEKRDDMIKRHHPVCKWETQRNMLREIYVWSGGSLESLES